MSEEQFGRQIARIAEGVLSRRFVVRLGAPLLYEVTVNERLEIEIDPARPSRGHSAFQTDLCVFERRPGGLEIPRVVLEFKTKLSTHDVLTYSAKALRHKRIYPYLRYGLVTAKETVVPKRFFLHNEALDFCIALGATSRAGRTQVVARLLRKEVRTARQLKDIAFGAARTAVYRSAVQLRV